MSHNRKYAIAALTGSDLILWIVIVLYTGIIYATLPVVPAVRKLLVERYGYDVFNWIYVCFGSAGAAFVLYGLIKLRAKARLRYFVALLCIGSAYSWYLVRLPYAIERIHLLEYGVLGVLLVIACARHMCHRIAFPCAVLLTYCIGLGDETVQHFLPNRVAEIRDGITNAVSGFLGTLLFSCTMGMRPSRIPFTRMQMRILFVICCMSVATTGLFIYGAHGFGHAHASQGCRFYSSLTAEQLDRINRSPARASLREMAIYENEAKRHLFQRDFYFTNDFLARDGSFYRDYALALGENRILESWYHRFLEKNGNRTSSEFSSLFDKKVGFALGDTPVVWPDSLKQWVGLRAGPSTTTVTSRVKSTVITACTPWHLLAAQVLAFLLLAIGWLIFERTLK
ncbi:MAG: VanZ family protein [Chitinispirillaceae bacterium]|nr:VanZ family protein [Chitinispirillaceae bacterium]